MGTALEPGTLPLTTLQRGAKEGARLVGKLAFTALDAVRSESTGSRILIYHQVGAGHGYQLDVPTAAFSEQMRWLTDRHRVVSLDTALAARTDTKPVVAVTFDDGYADMFHNAFPLLAELGIPFTLYLTTGPVEHGEPLVARPNSDPLTWDHIETMLESGLLTLGAHTHTHPDHRHATAAFLEDDNGRCDEIIERRTGHRPVHFAYPYGYWAAHADQVVRRRYQTAALGGTHLADTTFDGHLFHRVPIQLADRRLFFRSKLRRGSRTEESVRRRLTRYEGP